jgi:hypothetical protein
MHTAILRENSDYMIYHMSSNQLALGPVAVFGLANSRKMELEADIIGYGSELVVN